MADVRFGALSAHAGEHTLNTTEKYTIVRIPGSTNRPNVFMMVSIPADVREPA
jgi:hypothetical protein